MQALEWVGRAATVLSGAGQGCSVPLCVAAFTLLTSPAVIRGAEDSIVLLDRLVP